MSQPASASAIRTINLALQGGGSHGAFTWGVLDALLADPRIAIEGISGASAGAVNAVALADGHARARAAGTDPRRAARESLARVWGEVAALGSLGALQKGVASLLWGAIPKELAPTNFFAGAMQNWFSPYQSNPLDINPLRDLLTRLIDFEALGTLPSPKVFVSATHVNTGKAALFTGADVTPQAVMASACLPMLFRAVEIDGEAYWDGGYSVNPALTPLIDHCSSADIVLVQINPLRREDTPRTPADILDRVNELTFNASLLTQVRSIDFINRLLAEGSLHGTRCRRVLLHRIDGGAAIQDYPASSRASADPQLIQTLFRLGQTSGEEWLRKHFAALGQHSTIDIGRDYLDDTRLDSLPRPHGASATPAPAPRRGLKSFIGRLFGRKR
ncbi:MAG: patatin-like phospholipase family protein [Ramlibacter sp.]|nr:patatin-like phospholipase family protein [Ramlibacter sp.]